MKQILKVIAREFLWLLATLVLALPLTYLFLKCFSLVSANSEFSQTEKIFIGELVFMAYIFNFISIYLIRLVVGAIKTVAAPQ